MIPILIGSENDKVFLDSGLVLFKEQEIEHKVIVASVHRTPERSIERTVAECRQ